MRRFSRRSACLAVILWSAACVSRGSGSADGFPAPDPVDPAAVRAAQELYVMQVAWRQALASRDSAFFQRVLADEFVMTGDRGARSRSAFLAELARSAGDIPPARPEETHVRVFGDYAIATGILRYELASSPAPLLVRYSEVWVRRGGRWQALHGHHNPVQGVPAPSAAP